MEKMFNKCIKLLIIMTFFGATLRGNNQDSPTILCERHKKSDKMIVDLGKYEEKVFSQNGEDGIIQGILNFIGDTNRYYVEFGVNDGVECNTRLLREKYGWKGLSMDGGFFKPEINLQKNYITAENINDLFEMYGVPLELDLLSIDIDYNDFYVWQAIDSKYSPKIVIMEYNATHSPSEDKIAVYSPDACWDGTNYFGASILALARLGNVKGYTLVYADNNGVNLFFVRKDILKAIPYFFKNAGDISNLYKFPKYGSGPNGGHPADPLNRPYIKSLDVLPKNKKWRPLKTPFF
jgi:hypothetical protein